MATKSFDAKLAAVRAGDAKAVRAAAVPHTEPVLLVPVFGRMCEDGVKLSIDREQQTPFVLRLLREHETRGEVAALALGGARIAAATAPLIEWCAGCTPAQRLRVGYVALALLRSDEANAFLLDAVRGNGKADAIGAARALATFKEELADRLRTAAAEHRDPAVRREVDDLLA